MTGARLVGPVLVAAAAASATAGAQAPAARPDTLVPCARAVADGSRVRLRAPDHPPVVGTAVGWGTPAPRVVTTRGDTVAVAPWHTRDLSLGRTGRHTWTGAILGMLAGAVVAYATCDAQDRTYCGEQNPLPLLGAGAGAVVGQRKKRERWRQLAPDAACLKEAGPGGA